MATVTKSESAVNNARRMGIAVSTESKGPAGSNSRGGREFGGRVTTTMTGTRSSRVHHADIIWYTFLVTSLPPFFLLLV